MRTPPRHAARLVEPYSTAASRGNTAPVRARATADIDDQSLIAAYCQASATDDATAQHHATYLAYLGTWLRATPDHEGKARPTLSKLKDTLMASGGRAIDSHHVQAFRASQAGTEWAREGIGGALDALVRGDTMQRPVRAADISDQALITAYRQVSTTDDATAQHHATYLAHLGTWLRATPDDNGRPRPTLSQLKDTLIASGGRAIDNRHVQAFQASKAATDSARKNSSGALDALVRGNSAQRPVRAADISDQALIAAYRQASKADPRAAKDHATNLAHLGTWLRETPDDNGRPRPTLSQLKDALIASGGRPIDNPHVQAFQASQAGSITARARIGVALDALIHGNTTPRPLLAADTSDQALLSAYRETSTGNTGTVQNHVNYLAHLGTWLRETPDDEGRPRPTLSELKDMLVASGGRARHNPHVQAFKASQAATPSVRTNSASALDALVRANPTQRR